MRKFNLVRTEDISGVSGIGIVAEGVQFSDGAIALRWLSKHKSTAIYDCIADVQATDMKDERG